MKQKKHHAIRRVLRFRRHQINGQSWYQLTLLRVRLFLKEIGSCLSQGWWRTNLLGSVSHKDNHEIYQSGYYEPDPDDVFLNQSEVIADIIRVREQLGLERKYVAEAAGFSVEQYTRMEEKKRKMTRGEWGKIIEVLYYYRLSIQSPYERLMDNIDYHARPFGLNHKGLFIIIALGIALYFNLYYHLTYALGRLSAIIEG